MKLLTLLIFVGANFLYGGEVYHTQEPMFVSLGSVCEVAEAHHKLWTP